MRIAENQAVASRVGPCESVFHLIGPSQVGLSGLSTMRMLAELASSPDIAVWPYDARCALPITLVEIYAAAFAAMPGPRPIGPPSPAPPTAIGVVNSSTPLSW